MLGNTANFISMVNSIRDSEIRLIFKKITKRNANTAIPAINDLINMIPNLDYDTTFIEIVGHCCMGFDYLFYDPDSSVRVLALEMIGCIIKRLQKSIVDYLSLIFPTLYLYVNDDNENVRDKAKGILDEMFQSNEKKKIFFAKLQSDICDKIQNVLCDLPGPESASINNELKLTWGRITSACLLLLSQLLSTIKITKSISRVINSISISKWLIIDDNNNFYPAITPFMRSTAYKYLITLRNVGELTNIDYYKIILLLKYENNNVSQSNLLNLLMILMDDNLITSDQISPIFVKSIVLYDPCNDNFRKFVNKIGNNKFLEECIEQISLMDNFEKAKLLFDTMVDKWDNGMALSNEFKLNLFAKMISDNPESVFLAKYPLDMFIMFSDNIEILYKSNNEKRCFEYLSKLPENNIKKWIQQRSNVSSELLINVFYKFGENFIRNIWENIDTIPINDKDSMDYLLFISLIIQNSEVVWFIKQIDDDNDKFIFFLKNFKRDYTILRCKEMHNLCISIIESNPDMIQYVSKIFPDDSLVENKISTIVSSTINDGCNINSDIYDYFEPNDDFLEKLLLSQTLKSPPVNQKLIPDIIARIPELAKVKHFLEFSKSVIAFVINNNIDPKSIVIYMSESTDFYFEFWSYFGFDNIDSYSFCKFLDIYLVKKIPWIPVYLYIRDTDWQYIPRKLWNYIHGKPELAMIAHEMNLKYALFCICAANSMTFDDFNQIDSLLVESLSTIKPPPIDNPDRTLQIIQMEWLQITPKPPKFICENDDDLQLNLRQTIIYLKYHLPTLSVFDPIYPLIIKGLENPNRLTFFYCLRIISLISNATTKLPAAQFVSKILKYLIDFAPFTTIIENEIISALKIAKYVNIKEFEQIVCECGPLFSSLLSTQLIRILLPLMQYFNSWDLLSTNLNGKLDINNPKNWNFISHCLVEMPYQKRISFIFKYKDIIPSLFSTLSFKSNEFELLVASFPITAKKWMNTLDDNQRKELFYEMKHQITLKIFKTIVKNILKLKLEGVRIKYNYQTLNLGILYSDDFSTPINLDLKFPEIFPFEDIVFNCNIGDRETTDMCIDKIKSTMEITQSVESGLKEWHSFILEKVCDDRPCTICFCYLDTFKQIPQVCCSVCNTKFHQHCISKWFEKCLNRTCPYCGSNWIKSKK